MKKDTSEHYEIVSSVTQPGWWNVEFWGDGYLGWTSQYPSFLDATAAIVADYKSRQQPPSAEGESQ
jgi:hypothetical protein